MTKLTVQGRLLKQATIEPVTLRAFDLIIVSTSGGKDSTAMLDRLVEQAAVEGCLHRVHAVHCDLGRVEWQGTRDLVEEHCRALGLPLHVVSRPQGDLLEHVRQRGMWPSASARYCTSDHKRGQASKVINRLARDLHRSLGRRVEVLKCLGFRADESPARKRRPVMSINTRLTNSVKRVQDFLPIHSWVEAEVWDTIERSGLRHHWAYDAGMPRLSCSFCVLASKTALVRAAQLRPDLASDYAQVEAEIDHRFRRDLSMAEIIEAAGTVTEIATDRVESWIA